MESPPITTYRVAGGFHARDPILRLTAFGISEEAARAELKRLRALSERLQVEFAASPRLHDPSANRVA